MKFPLLLLPLFFICSAWAEPNINITGNLQQIDITINADKQPMAVFRRFNDIWIVFANSDTPNINISKNLGLIEQETLSIVAGYGVRLRFPPFGDIWLNKNEPQSSTSKIKARQVNNNLHLLGNGIGSMFKATSNKTGESYNVLTINSITPQNSELIIADFRLIPTLTGKVITSVTGKQLQFIVDGDGYLIGSKIIRTKPINDTFLDNIMSDITTSQPVVTPLAKSETKTASFAQAISGVTSAIERIRKLPIPKKQHKPLQAAGSTIPKTKVENLYSEEELKKYGITTPTDAFNTKSLFGDFDSTKNYTELRGQILRRIIYSKGDTPRSMARLGLAQLAISNKRVHEALGIIDTMPTFKLTGQPRLDEARIIKGAALGLLGRAEEAKTVLEVPAQPEKDKLLWAAFAEEKLGNDSKAISLFKRNIKVSEKYPLYLQQELRLAYARALLRKEKISRFEKQIDELGMLAADAEMPPEAFRLLAHAYMIKGDIPEAEKMLSLASNSDDPNISYMAKYEFISHLLEQGDITINQAMEHMQKLSYAWRGGKLEEEILYRLSRLYLEAGMYRKGLEQMKSYTIYFPNSQWIGTIAALMTQTFAAMFENKERAIPLDKLAIIALYYDFRELTPLGEEGDKLIAGIITRLRELSLYPQARKVLQSQLKYRLKTPSLKAKAGADLAELYFLEHNIKKAHKALDKTEQKVSIPASILRQRGAMRARLYIYNGDYKNARLALNGIGENPEIKALKAKIAWRTQNSYEFIRLIEPEFLGENVKFNFSEYDQQNFFRLALVYNNTAQLGKLERLTNRYKDELTQEDGKRYLNLLLHDIGYRGEPIKVDPKQGRASALDVVTKQFASYSNFRYFYEEFKQSRDDAKRQRYLFNRNMQQLTAPPRI